MRNNPGKSIALVCHGFVIGEMIKSEVDESEGEGTLQSQHILNCQLVDINI